MKTRPWSWLAPLVGLLVAAAAPDPASPSAAAAAAAALGRWEGVVFAEPARFELDLTLEIAREGQELVGYLSVPTRDIAHRRLDQLVVEDGQVSFLYKDPTGDSKFSGFMGAANQELAGQFSEGSETFLCKFSRAAGAGPRVPPAIHDLGADGAELRQRFNADQANPRLLMILSPTCHECKVGALVAQRYLLTGRSLPELRVYVIWEPAQGHDEREAAVKAAALLNDDPRVTQFWSRSRFAGKAFKEPLGFASAAAWDVFLLFAPGSRWTEQAPPIALSMNNRSQDPNQHLEAKVLAAKVRDLMPGAR